MNKYKSPFPGRQIVGNDFNDLVKYVNTVIEESALNIERQNLIENKINEFNEQVEQQINRFNEDYSKNESSIQKTLLKVQQLNERIEAFYGKIIEIVGIFVAIFSFIIVGAQISFKVESESFIDLLSKSAGIFIPILLCIIILLFMIKWI